jgi:hypothetical protein
MPAPFTTPVARSTPYDPTTVPSYITATNVQDAIDQIATNAQVSASPSMSWGKAGQANSNTWLENESVASNVVGRVIFLYSPKLAHLYAASQNLDTYSLEIYEHDGVTYTLLTTVSVVAARSASFDFSPTIDLTRLKQLAVKISAGSAKNIVVGAIVRGTSVP